MDALTTANQNQAVALNSITQSLQYVTGQYTSKAYAGPLTQQLTSTAGRMVNVAVLVAGGGAKFYNTASTTAILDENLLYVLPSSATVGITTVGVQFSNGLVMVLDAGATINVTYSVGV